MSGIAGILNRDGAPVDRSQLETMTETLRSAGPDGENIWIDGSVGLSHTLLSTGADPTAGQPRTVDGWTWITADARVDGRKELIAALRSHGTPTGPGTPDDALILHAYRAWGERCVDHLLGDFAFAIWDTEKRRLFCARDHFGLIPFYYAAFPGGLAFSNTLRSVRAHPAVSDRLDEQAIGDFLLFGANMDLASTTFADVRLLPPGHMLTWAEGTTRTRRYWELPVEQEPLRYKHSQDLVEQFATIFDEAVGDRLRGQAAGTHLSGGLDSTSVAVTAHKCFTDRGQRFDLRGYTVVFDWLVGEEEAHFADQVAAQIDIPTEHVVAEDHLLRPPSPTASWVFPEPSTVDDHRHDYELLRRVSAFSRVLLTGMGGDPLFHPGSPNAGWLDVIRAAGRDALANRRLPRLGVRTAVRHRLVRRQGPPELPAWIDPIFARRVDLVSRYHRVIAQHQAVGPRESLLSPAWVTMFRTGHPGAHGLPVKALFPFFDRRLVEYVLRTPPYPWRDQKRLLREAMRGRLPEAVRSRPKTLLYVARSRADPGHPWAKLGQKPEMRAWRRELIRGAPIAQFLDPQRLLLAIETPLPLNVERQLLRNSLSLASWLRYGQGSITEEETLHVEQSAGGRG